jgi:hypothetical protein
MRALTIRRLLHRNSEYGAAPMPRRSDAIDHWLRDQREQADPSTWHTINNLLDRYRLHADTKTPLDMHVCRGLLIGDCECFEQADCRESQ